MKCGAYCTNRPVFLLEWFHFSEGRVAGAKSRVRLMGGLHLVFNIKYDMPKPLSCDIVRRILEEDVEIQVVCEGNASD